MLHSTLEITNGSSDRIPSDISKETFRIHPSKCA